MRRILYRHLMWKELKLLFLIFALCASIVFVFMFAEGLKHISSMEDCAIIALLRTPYMCCSIFPFIFFAAALRCIWILAAENCVIVMKTSKLSTLNLMIPFCLMAVFSAIFWLFILQPIGIASREEADNLEASATGTINEKRHIWVDHNTAMLHAHTLHKHVLDDVYLMEDDEMYYMPTANIASGGLIFHEFDDDGRKVPCEKSGFPMPNARQLIRISSVLPQHIPIYELWGMRHIAPNSDLSLQWHILLSGSMLFLIFTVVAAIIALPLTRFPTKILVGIRAICVAVPVKFINEMIESLFHSGYMHMNTIYVMWMPNVIILLVCIGYLIWNEE